MTKKRGRPAGLSEEKKKAILASARVLFKAHGFKKVSIDEICREADSSRMTFYKHFQDKVDLAIAILEEENEGNIGRVNQVLKQQTSFLEKFETFKKLNLDLQNRVGTLFMKDILGPDSDLKMKEFFKKMSKDIETQTQKFLRMGQKEGAISSDLPMNFLFLMVQIINEIYFRPELVQIFPDPIKRGEILNDFYFYGVKSKKT